MSAAEAVSKIIDEAIVGMEGAQASAMKISPKETASMESAVIKFSGLTKEDTKRMRGRSTVTVLGKCAGAQPRGGQWNTIEKLREERPNMPCKPTG